VGRRRDGRTPDGVDTVMVALVLFLVFPVGAFFVVAVVHGAAKLSRGPR
jgi:hypothetical protein